MTATDPETDLRSSASPPAPPGAGTPARPASLAALLRFELAKVAGQTRVRLLLVACLLLPAVFVVVVSRQSTLPTDTVFGRWMGQTGWAGSLVVLAFVCSWGLPLLLSLVAGDVLAGEDRLGTWRHLLVAAGSPRRIVVAKAVTCLLLVTVLVACLAASAIAGGLLGVGGRPLVGLDGHELAFGEAARAVVLAWVCVLAPALAFAALGLLGAAVLGRSPLGLFVPALVALALDLVLLLPVPLALRLALPSDALLAWRGLFTRPAHTEALLLGVGVSLLWALVATATAAAVLLRRDFTDLAHDGAAPRTVLVAAAPLLVLVAVSAGLLAVVGPGTGGPGRGIAKASLDRALAVEFAQLYVRQTGLLHRPPVSEAQLRSTADCDRGGERVADRGAGNDWRCVVTWRLPGSTAQGQAVYQLDVAAEGRFVADGDGPRDVNGSFTVRTPTGDAPNPLWQFDGYVDLVQRP